MRLSTALRLLAPALAAVTVAAAGSEVRLQAEPSATQQSATQVRPPTPPTTTMSGVWETVRVNRSALPMTDEVVGTDGFTHAVRLHEMTIRLRPNNRFQASLHFRRAILSRGEKITGVPLQTDTWIGTYTLDGDRMRFVPDRRDGQQIQPFTGTRAGRRITVQFDYHIVTRKTYVLEMNRNDSII